MRALCQRKNRFEGAALVAGFGRFVLGGGALFGRGKPMQKISDYLKHAEECEKLARTANTSEHAETLRKMAATWRELAQAREREIRRQERLNEPVSENES